MITLLMIVFFGILAIKTMFKPSPSIDDTLDLVLLICYIIAAGLLLISLTYTCWTSNERSLDGFPTDRNRSDWDSGIESGVKGKVLAEQAAMMMDTRELGGYLQAGLGGRDGTSSLRTPSQFSLADRPVTPVAWSPLTSATGTDSPAAPSRAYSPLPPAVRPRAGTVRHTWA